MSGMIDDSDKLVRTYQMIRVGKDSPTFEEILITEKVLKWIGKSEVIALSEDNVKLIMSFTTNPVRFVKGLEPLWLGLGVNEEELETIK